MAKDGGIESVSSIVVPMKLISCSEEDVRKALRRTVYRRLGSASTRVCRLVRGRIGKVGVLRLRLEYSVRWGEK